jgi:hypothetical protein
MKRALKKDAHTNQIQPRSGGSAVSPGREPRVEWNEGMSRVSGATVLA